MAFTGQTPSSWKATINALFTTELVKGKNQQVWPKYLDEDTADDKFVDDVEKVGLGLFSETDEGQEMNLDSYSEGFSVRYQPRKFTKRVIVPEENYEDNKYPEQWDVPKMLASAALLSQEYDAVAVLNNMTTSTVTGGDGVCFANASHPLKGGSTYSNVSSGLTPSETSLETLLVTCDKMPGSNGFVVGIKGVRVVGPSNHRFTMKKLLMSGSEPDTANNAINALKGEVESTYVAVPWMSSTTQYGIKTNVDDGAKWYWKRKLKLKVSNDDVNDIRVHTASYRSDRGWSNPRGYVWVNV